MATDAYWAWDRDGRPWRVAAPILAVGTTLRRYGYTVYYLGSDDESHLKAARPQDHCPFSTTGWPVKHPYPWVTAFDVMPPPRGSGLPSLQQLGAQIVDDRNAGEPGLAWLKYMNWEPDRDNGGRCFQDSWKPNHVRTGSTDRGHIHGSGRSDMVVDAGAAATYDPVARIRGTAPTAPEVPDMQVITIARGANGQWYACDGATSRPITQAEAADIAYLANEGRWGVCWGIGGVGTPRDGWYEAAFGRVEETRAERAASYQREADTLAATQQVLAAIKAAGGDPSALDQTAIIAHINGRADEVVALLEESEAEKRELRERLAAALRAGETG